MWSLFKRKNKKIDTTQIKSFNDAIKVIEDFIKLEEFSKAETSINEIRAKENASFQAFIENIKEKDKKTEIEKFKKKISKIDSLKEKLQKNKEVFEKELNIKKKIIEKKYIEKTITELIGNKKFQEAGSMLNEYIEKNPNSIDIINYVNKQRKKLTKLIEKEKRNREKQIRNDTILEAKSLIGELQEDMSNKNEKKKTSFLEFIKGKFNIRKKLKEKRLLDEISLLIENQNSKNELLARKKLEQVHMGLSKVISGNKINGYELYGKILGADKISGDAIGFSENKKNYNFFIGDATGHGVKAGITISNLTRNFNSLAKKENLKEIVLNINNSLKQDIKSGNFITSIFFNINKENNKEIKVIGMGHEPVFIYRNKTKTVEKMVMGGLAAGIRIIKEIANIKEKTVVLEDGDILLAYTDGIVESKNENGEMYSIERIGEKFLEFARNEKISLEVIYDRFKNDLKNFTSGKHNYNDDVTIMLLKRDVNKEILEKEEDIIKVIEKEGLEKSYKKKIKGKTLEEIKEDIKKIQNEKAIKNIIKSLEFLYKSGELTRLKQDAIKYIREGYIHKKINFYLKKAIDNENLFKIKQKEKKIQDKYNILKELYKKGDYETVIYECSNIISKDGNI